MAINIKRNDVRAQLWTIPGPLFVCCILLTIVLKSSLTPLMLPIIAVGGVAACTLWKWRGVAASSAILAAMMVYSLQSQPSQSWIWTIALSLSIVSTFVLTVLCSEEAYHALDQLSKDSTDHKQTLSLLNERLQLLQSKLIAEQSEFNLQKSQLEEQLAAKEEKQRSNEQLLKLARNEITGVVEKQKKLLQELFQTNEKNGVLEQKIVELQSQEKNVVVQDHSLVNELQRQIAFLHHQKQDLESALLERKDLEKTIETLQTELEGVSLLKQDNAEQIEKLKSVLESTRAEFEKSECKQHELLELIASHKETIVSLSSEKEVLKEAIPALSAEKNELQEAIVTINSENDALKKAIATLSAEKDELREAIPALSAEKHELQEAIIVINSENDALKKTILTLSSEKDELLGQIQSKSQSEVIETPDVRQIEGLYQQLRQQFAEKTQVLSATRKELFLAQEKLSVCQIDGVEAKIDAGRETIESIQRLSNEVEKEFARMEQEHSVEVAHLHDIIRTLSV